MLLKVKIGCNPFQVILEAHESITSTSTNLAPFQCCSRMPQQRSMGLYLLLLTLDKKLIELVFVADQ